MSCNSCAKPFTFLRQERGCPKCGFSYCSKCLNNKVFIQKLNKEAKVCLKCKKCSDTNEQAEIQPPDAYYRRIGEAVDKPSSSNHSSPSEQVQTIDSEIHDRLQKLKGDPILKTPQMTTEEKIALKLQNIKGEIPSTSDAELQTRLAKLRGFPTSTASSKAVLPAPDLRTEQEQADDLMRQYLEQSQIDAKYKDEFDEVITSIATRIQKLKGSTSTSTEQSHKNSVENDSEEETIKNIIDKAKAESSIDAELNPSTDDELPFCEICNEDANMRCLGCRYLFCKRCFQEHKDDDDGCNRFEPYKPPKNLQA